eukprot:4507299-Prorocentrum_lima.AAC.1
MEHTENLAQDCQKQCSSSSSRPSPSLVLLSLSFVKCRSLALASWLSTGVPTPPLHSFVYRQRRQSHEQK